VSFGDDHQVFFDLVTVPNVVTEDVAYNPKVFIAFYNLLVIGAEGAKVAFF